MTCLLNCMFTNMFNLRRLNAKTRVHKIIIMDLPFADDDSAVSTATDPEMQ